MSHSKLEHFTTTTTTTKNNFKITLANHTANRKYPKYSFRSVAWQRSVALRVQRRYFYEAPKLSTFRYFTNRQL